MQELKWINCDIHTKLWVERPKESVMPYIVLSASNLLTLDLQEAVRLSKPGGIPGLELMETSGHWNALEELSQRMLQKVTQRPIELTAGTFSAHWTGISTCGS
jgi:hypothetical protein